MAFFQAPLVVLLLFILAVLRRDVGAFPEGPSQSVDLRSIETESEHADSGKGSAPHRTPFTEAFRRAQSQAETQAQTHAAYEALNKDARWSKPVCSNGLRLAFDCALKRVIAFGVRDYLVDKYKLPMAPLEVCQGEILLDVEQCIPDDFVNTFPSDTLLKIVRQKRITVGTMDFSVFPQLASDQGHTTGFYPELVQAIVRELTVIALQNPGLRRELVGDRPLDLGILEEPFSKRLEAIRVGVAREWQHGVSCEARASIAASGLRQFPASSGAPQTQPENPLPGNASKALPWQEARRDAGAGLLCGESQRRTSTCQLHGCLSPWDQIPKDVLIGVTHVKFSTPMNLIAAVYRGEVHMTDVGTLASSYLPERYNFLPLREVLEPSCTIGAWKSFFLLRDPASKRRLRYSTPDTERKNSSRLSKDQPPNGASTADESNRPRSSNSTTEFRGAYSDSGSNSGRLSSASSDPRYMEHLDLAESWEDRMEQTRKLFFKLYGVQAEGSTSSDDQQQEALPTRSPGSASGFSEGRSADTEMAYDEKTLVKFHHVDHFSFSYLFPEDFRIYSVRKLTDLSSLLSDGEPIGAFGYGLAGRGGRRRMNSSSSRHCPPQQRQGQRILNAGLGSAASLMTPKSLRKSSCNLQSLASRSLKFDDGLPNIVEFPGPLVPLAAFFAKSRDPVCRGFRKPAVTAATEKPASLSSAAAPTSLTFSFAFVLGALIIINVEFVC